MMPSIVAQALHLKQIEAEMFDRDGPHTRWLRSLGNAPSRLVAEMKRDVLHEGSERT